MSAIKGHDNKKNWMGEVQGYVRKRRSIEFSFSADGAALLVIDMQRYFTDPSSHAYFPQVERIVGNVQQIMDAFRTRGLPVLYTRHAVAKGEDPGMMGRWWGDILALDDPFSAIDERFAPLATETVVRKTRYSAFIGTGFQRILEDLKVTRLVIVGVMTHLCCESTARDAFMHDRQVFFMVDATATNDDALHLGSLRALADGFAILTTTQEVMSWLQPER
jgi:isochorismate hydrolase